MSRIFLSHSSKDNFEAIALRDWLASEGWNDVFLDLDPDCGIAPSERWERALHAAATRCEAVIFLVSANWLASGWCRKEYALARSLNKKLFAVLIDLAKPIHDILPELKGTWHVVNLVGGQELQLSRTLLPGSHEEKHVGFTTDGLRRLKRGLEKAGLDPISSLGRRSENQLPLSSEALSRARRALQAEWGKEPVLAGCGGANVWRGDL
jgi:hypothetical protein